MKSDESYPGYSSVMTAFSGKTGVSTRSVCVAFGQNWGSNGTCSRRASDIGNPTSGGV